MTAVFDAMLAGSPLAAATGGAVITGGGVLFARSIRRAVSRRPGRYIGRRRAA